MSGTKLGDVTRRYQSDGSVIRGTLQSYLNGALTLRDVEDVLGVTGLAAELLKKNIERKTMHEMLTEMGVPTESAGSGEGICLIGRLALVRRR